MMLHSVPDSAACLFERLNPDLSPESHASGADAVLPAALAELDCPSCRACQCSADGPDLIESNRFRRVGCAMVNNSGCLFSTAAYACSACARVHMLSRHAVAGVDRIGHTLLV